MKPMMLLYLWSHSVLSHQTKMEYRYCQTSNMRRTLVGKNIVDHPDVVGASPVADAPTTSSFSTEYLASMYWAETTAGRNENH